MIYEGKTSKRKIGGTNASCIDNHGCFKGPMTTTLLQKIASNNIQSVKVPSNLTHIYQPFDVTVNDATKQFMKRKFEDWYPGQIVTEMNKGTDVEEIDVQMKLFVMKPLHVSWLLELYNYMTLRTGYERCMKGKEWNL